MKIANENSKHLAHLFNLVQTIFHGMTKSVMPQYIKCHAMEINQSQKRPER